MTRVVLVAVAMVLFAMPAHAQVGTAAGVDAFLRGDYPRAAAILQPLADTPWQPDHTAEFFLAVLYDGGLGVSPDAARACALFIRASADPSSPLGAAASGVVRARQRTLDREAFDTCNWRASAGFEDRFEPVTFPLDQEHWIAWDLEGVTIAYRGVEKRINRPHAPSHARFVAIRYVALMTGETRATRRHFVDLSWWVPLKQARTWSLTWSLFEVVRDELIAVSPQTLVTATGEEPPATTTRDLAALVDLRVNDDGNPEWSVLTGPSRRTQVIESDAERQEWKRFAAQQARARQGGPRTDRVLDVHRPPRLAYAAADVDGCAGLFVYGWTADRSEAIAVRVNRELLNSGAGTFDLAASTAGVDVRVHVYGRAMASFPFCTDVGMSGLVEEGWRVTRGTIAIQLSPAGLPVRAPGHQRVTIRISGAQFVNSSGARVDQTEPITLAAIVGGGGLGSLR